MILGYNTNGLAHHSLPDAIRLLAGIGYRGIAITLDHATLNPYGKHLSEEIAETRKLLAAFNMTSVIETGARYLLDPANKHQPTLLAADKRERDRRIDFLRRSIDIAAEFGSRCVSLWSGVLPAGESREVCMARLVEGLHVTLEHAASSNIIIAFEPEPGMLIDTMNRFAELVERVDSPVLKLTLDVGHLHCLGETPIADVIRRWQTQLVNAHIEDMRSGVHEHLMFGEGEIDFPPMIAALIEVGYDGPLNVELSRHSHMGPQAARAAYEFLKGLLANSS